MNKRVVFVLPEPGKGKYLTNPPVEQYEQFPHVVDAIPVRGVSPELCYIRDGVVVSDSPPKLCETDYSTADLVRQVLNEDLKVLDLRLSADIKTASELVDVKIRELNQSITRKCVIGSVCLVIVAALVVVLRL